MNDQKSDTPMKEFETERAYLEKMLVTRINFYLVFISFYLVAVFKADPGIVSSAQRSIAMILGGVISLAMALSVLRTTALVEHVLRNFRAKYPDHPYSSACEHLEGRAVLAISANYFLALLPRGITIAFFALALA